MSDYITTHLDSVNETGKFYFSDGYIHWQDDNDDNEERYEYERMPE